MHHVKAIFFRTYLFLFLFLGLGFYSTASHIRAGEITVERLSQNTFRFTLTIYANEDVFPGVQNETAIFDFGDGTVSNEIGFTEDNHSISPDIYRRTYIVTHTYTGNGFFKVSYQEEWRVANIENITNSGTVSLYLETMVSVAAQNTGNRPPYLQVPPIDDGKVGAVFTHNAGAVDPDGDSLSYKLVIPKATGGANAQGYTNPTASTSFSLDPVTGDLVWDAPLSPGIYNVAFIIEEWRKTNNGYVRISYITRDMQIKIINSPNNPPEVHLPADTCIVAGSTITKTITATDPDLGDRVTLTCYPNSYFSTSGIAANPKSGTFSWPTTCADVRQQPYFFTFRAEDDHIDVLTDIETWQIQVIAPAPTGLTTTGLSNGIKLDWTLYPCSNADKIVIYRLECDSIEYTQTACENGIEGFPGYTKIGEVADNINTYTDLTTKQGTLYCYIIVATFPSPAFGTSYASLQSCASMANVVPVITSVSVTSTSATNGQIQINWIAPLSSTLPLPYQYIVYRSDNNGVSYSAVSGPLTATNYLDINLNTEQIQYRYKIEIVGEPVLSDGVSSTYLTATGANQSAVLNWTEFSSWLNDSLDIYRSINGAPFTFVTRLIPGTSGYTDLNLTNCDTVCYYTNRYHHYCLEDYNSTYSQLSQESCAVPKDDSPPPPPVLTVTGCGNDLSIFANTLNWTDVSDPDCPNIISYRIYYSEYRESNLSLLATVPFTQLTYTDVDSQSLAGCYIVKAVNYASVEGSSSNKVCVDDCVFYELPNLITPNGDDKNDKFNPFPIPRGVKVVTLRVFNNWGQQVYANETGPILNWGGLDGAGNPLSDGVYFFSAEVSYFRRLNPKDETRIIKGWVHIIDRNTAGNEK